MALRDYTYEEVMQEKFPGVVARNLYRYNTEWAWEMSAYSMRIRQ